jgi:hypothetical protein
LPALAKYLYDDICKKAGTGEDMRFGPGREAYTHPRNEGKLIANDFTGFLPEHKDWGKARDNGRPSILFQLKCTDSRKEHKRLTKFECLKDDEGRIYLNPDGFAIRKLNHIPHPVSSEITGWEMEAICRLNPNVGDLDFRDRMAPAIRLKSISTKAQKEEKKANGGRNKKQYKKLDGRPNRSSINQRRSRARHEMRVLKWPHVDTRESTIFDRKIHEIDEWGKKNNSTEHLVDLSQEQIAAFEASSYGSVMARAGTKALDKGKRAARMQNAVDKMKKGGFTEDSAEVKALRKRFTDSQHET